MTPSYQLNESKEEEAWRDVTPQCQSSEGSEEYEAWLKATIEANPACQSEGSEEYEAWLKTMIEANPACNSKGSEEYEALAQSDDRGKSCMPARRIGGVRGLAQKEAGRASEDFDETNG